eukprot:2327520-Pleurochrysis_carterae.AAC.1
MRCPTRASSSADVRSRRPTGAGRHAPVPTQLGRSTGSSATPEGTRVLEAGVLPAAGDPGRLRPTMTAT